MGCGWARWPQRCQSGLHTTDKSGSSLGENSYNISQETGLFTFVLEALLGSKREARPGSGSGSGFPCKLS